MIPNIKKKHPESSIIHSTVGNQQGNSSQMVSILYMNFCQRHESLLCLYECDFSSTYLRILFSNCIEYKGTISKVTKLKVLPSTNLIVYSVSTIRYLKENSVPNPVNSILSVSVYK